MTAKPLVSICIPTYNGEDYLAEALQSALNQTYKNIEIVISDDASTDKTLEIVNQFKNQSTVPFYIFHHTPAGIGANWNHCMQNAHGEYIKFLFQDDVLLPNCVEKMVEVFQSNSHVGLVASKRKIIISNEKKTGGLDIWLRYYKNLQAKFENKEDDFTFLDKTFFKSQFFLNKPVNVVGEPTAVMFTRDLINKIGFFNESFEQILDYEYWYRILRKFSLVIINEKLVCFRLHDKQATALNSKRKIADYDEYEKILYEDYFGLLNLKLKLKLLEKFHPLLKFIIPILKKLRRLVLKFL